MDKLKDFKRKLEMLVEEEMSKPKEEICANDLGEAVDMIKDLAEAEYYCKITEAMDKPENQYGVNYDYRGRYGYMPLEDRMMGEPVEWFMPQTGVRYDKMDRMGYTGQVGGNVGMRNSSNYKSSNITGGNMSRGSRYGYSHDDYLQKMDMYDAKNPDMKQKRRELINERVEEMKEMLTDTIDKMTPEEQQMWKVKIMKVLE